MLCKDVHISMSNYRNSCYLDALIVALFHSSALKEKMLGIIFGDGIKSHKNRHSRVINKRLLKLAEDISQELRRIANELVVKEIKVPTTCSAFRELLQQYHDIYINKVSLANEKINWVTDELEPLDVLSIFQTIFKARDIMSIEKVTLVTKSIAHTIAKSKWKVLESERTQASHIDIISLEDLQAFQDPSGNIKLQRFYPVSARKVPLSNTLVQQHITHKLQQVTIQSTPALFVIVSRLMGDIKITTPVIPLHKITCKDGTVLKLSSIIIHHGNGIGGGHYTCCYKCGNTFYEYDDLRRDVSKIGSMVDLKTHKNGYILKNAVLFLYA